MDIVAKQVIVIFVCHVTIAFFFFFVYLSALISGTLEEIAGFDEYEEESIGSR